MCPIPFDEAVFIPQLSSAQSVIHNAAPTALVIEDRSRSRSPLRQRPVGVFSCRSRSSSSSPRRSRCSHPRPASPSPYLPYTATPRCPSRSRSLSPSPIPIIQPEPPQIGSPPSWCAAPPSDDPPTQVPQQRADILTFDYNENIAYAPAAKTYDEAIDIVLELWPELREVERDQIRLFLTDSDHLVRIPRMTWSTVLCDVPCYEVVHVKVEQLLPSPPPPQYQGKDKETRKWKDNNEKGRRSSGQFSSIRRIFFG
jgi:hypothetical protein